MLSQLGLARVKPEVQKPMEPSTLVSGTQVTVISFSAFPGLLAGAGSEVEAPGLDPTFRYKMQLFPAPA